MSDAAVHELCVTIARLPYHCAIAVLLFCGIVGTLKALTE